MLQKLLILIPALGAGLCSLAQYTTTGSATPDGCGKWIVTPDSPSQTGSIYQATAVNLNTDFSLSFNVNFGCDNNGGCGLVFVFRNGPWAVGSGSSGMGYQGMTGNTLAVEFDTRDDAIALSNWDITADHIGLFTGGSINHNPTNPLNLMGTAPTNILPSQTNVENCEDYLVVINWNADFPAAGQQTITVTVNGETSLTKSSNFVAAQFAGNPSVLWGWTGATSTITGVDNQQTVGIGLNPDFTISATNCPGQLVNFTNQSTGQNPIVGWSWDFGGLGTSSLSNPSFTFPTAGSYDIELTITDNAGCTKTETIPIGIGFIVDPTADDSPICPNSSTTLHANAAPYVGNTCCFDLLLHDAWGDGWGFPVNQLLVYEDGVLIGTYTPFDAGGGTPTTDVINLCFTNGSVIELVTQGTSSPGECSYELVDADGNVAASLSSWPTGGPPSFITTNTQTYTVDCGSAPPAYTYSWTPPGPLGGGSTSADPTATLATTTTFTVAVTDPSTGCTISDDVTVTTSAPVTAVISGNQTVCDGDSANLQVNFTGTPPFTLLINGPGGPMTPITGIGTMIYNLSVSEDGDYTITDVTGDGCDGDGSGTGTLDVIIPPVVDIAASAEYCDGDVIAALTVLSGGGGTVNWYNNPGLTGTPLGSGTSYTPTQGVGTVTYYAATTETILGCVGPADNVVITVHPIPPAPTWTGNTTYCEGDLPTPLTGIPSLGGTITWYDNPPPATVLSTLASYNPTLNVGTLTLHITETANGCESPSTPISILVKPTPDAPVVTGDLLYCEGDSPTSLTATPSLGGTIAWENSLGVNVATGTSYTPPLSNGLTTYTVTETLDGCEGPPATTTIEVQPAPMVNVTNQVSICIGDSILISALNNGYEITWSDGQEGEEVYLGPDTVTTYYVTATNPLCGFAVDSIKINVNYLPEVEAGNDTLIGIGGEVILWAESDPDVTYDWIPDPSECLNDDCSEIYDVPDQATVYVVIVTDPIGCQNSDSVLVDINGYMEVFVPNIFSPNGDGENDLLVINGPRLFNYYIQIYDRWGKVVFESTEQKEYWDGKLNGADLAPQTFVYMLSGESVLGDKIVQEGNVTIIK